MRGRSARLLFAFVLITKNSISWQYPTAQTQRRPSRDFVFPQDHTSIRSRVAGGENSEIPSGVAAIFGGSEGTTRIPSLPPPPIIIPDGVEPRPSREDIKLDRLAETQQANTQRVSAGRPPTPLLGQGGGSFIVYDEDLESFFRNCGDFLERCPVPNTPTHEGSHVHLHKRPVPNDGFHHGPVHYPFSQPSLTGSIPVWP